MSHPQRPRVTTKLPVQTKAGSVQYAPANPKAAYQNICLDISNTIALWSLQQRKMESNLFAILAQDGSDIVMLNGGVALPSQTALFEMDNMATKIREIQDTTAIHVVNYLAQPMDYTTIPPHTLGNKLAMIVREQAVGAGLDDDEDEDTSVTVTITDSKPVKRRSLTLADLVKQLVTKQEESHKVAAPKRIRLPSVLSSSKLNLLSNSRPSSPALGSPKLNRQQISDPLEGMADSRDPYDFIHLTNRNTILDLQKEAQNACGNKLSDITRMSESDRNQQLGLACAEVIVDYLPHLIVTGHAGPSTLGEGQHTADPSDVSRFHSSVRDKLLRTVVNRLVTGSDDTIKSVILTDLVIGFNQRAQRSDNIILRQNLARYTPSFQSDQITAWNKQELQPNMVDFANLPSMPIPDARDGLPARPKNRKRYNSACSVMTCTVRQRSILLETCSRRLGDLCRDRPAINVAASQSDFSPHPQLIGLMLFFASALDQVTNLRAGMIGLLGKLKAVEKVVKNPVAIPILDFPAATAFSGPAASRESGGRPVTMFEEDECPSATTPELEDYYRNFNRDKADFLGAVNSPIRDPRKPSRVSLTDLVKDAEERTLRPPQPLVFLERQLSTVLELSENTPISASTIYVALDSRPF